MRNSESPYQNWQLSLAFLTLFQLQEEKKLTLKSIFVSIICVCLIFSLLRETDFSKSIV
jgi:hypothetical protein